MLYGRHCKLATDYDLRFYKVVTGNKAHHHGMVKVLALCVPAKKAAQKCAGGGGACVLFPDHAVSDR